MPEPGENKAAQLAPEVLENLKACTEPLELVFGEDVTRLFETDTFIEKIGDLRARLYKDGIQMPLLRMRDYAWLGAREFLVLSYQEVLYAGRVEDLDWKALDQILGCVETVMRSSYQPREGEAARFSRLA